MVSRITNDKLEHFTKNIKMQPRLKVVLRISYVRFFTRGDDQRSTQYFVC